VYPTNKQQEILNKWFGASRYIYNNVLEYINNSKHPDKFKIKHLRSRFIHNKNYQNTNTWMLDIPFDVRDEALRTLLKNYKTNFKKSKHFQIKFKTKKSIWDSISVLKKYWNQKTERGSFYKAYNNWKIENIGKINLTHDSRLRRNVLNQYYLCVPTHCDINSKKLCLENQERNEICSIDPGLRTLFTVYDPNGNIHKIADKDISQIARLVYYKNKLRSQFTKRNYRRAFYRLQFKIANMVDNLYKLVSLYLVCNYKCIVIPKLNFHMLNRLHRKQKQLLQTISHCNFVEYLKTRAQDYGTKVLVCDESYTSKTCTRCGYLNNNLGSRKWFICGNCNLEIDRDVNGSRNILIKSLQVASVEA